MKAFVINLLTASLLLAHVDAVEARSTRLTRLFYQTEFAGMVSPASAGYEEAVLDYELETPDGTRLHFASCPQVEAADESAIVESQFSLFKLLKTNCRALRHYSESTNARRSYFPPRLTKAVIAALPANAGVRISNEDPNPRARKNLAGHEKPVRISIDKNGRAKLVTSADEITYTIMARADFDDDGIEDLLVRMDWRSREAMGKGNEVIVLSRKSRAAPITLRRPLD